VPASGGNIEAVQSASSNKPDDEALRKVVNDQVTLFQVSLPMLLQQAMVECKNKENLDSSSTTEKDPPERVESASYYSARFERYYTSSKETEVSEDVFAFIKTAFSKQLDKEVWTNLMERYPQMEYCMLLDLKVFLLFSLSSI
jgi:hypothetical protein